MVTSRSCATQSETFAEHEATGVHEIVRPERRIMVVGGMDTLPPARILGSLVLGCDGAGLPAHRAVVVTLHRHRDDAVKLPYTLSLRVDIPRRARRDGLCVRRGGSWLDAKASALATRVLTWADARAEFDGQGRGRNWVGRLMARPIRMPLSYLYDPRQMELEYERLVALLESEQPTTIIGASFGGSVVLDTLIRAFHAKRLAPRPLTLLTLGTNFGEILTKSPLYRGLPRTSDGRIACPDHLRWLHFFSPSDVFVAASALPHRFAGVKQVRVHTGPLLTWPLNRAHGMARYLRTPAVQDALRAALVEPAQI